MEAIHSITHSDVRYIILHGLLVELEITVIGTFQLLANNNLEKFWNGVSAGLQDINH